MKPWEGQFTGRLCPVSAVAEVGEINCIDERWEDAWGRRWVVTYDRATRRAITVAYPWVFEREELRAL